MNNCPMVICRADLYRFWEKIKSHFVTHPAKVPGLWESRYNLHRIFAGFTSSATHLLGFFFWTNVCIQIAQDITGGLRAEILPLLLRFVKGRLYDKKI